jgi:hypothetical protein
MAVKRTPMDEYTMQQQLNGGGSRPEDLLWRFWFTVPIYPYARRPTIRREVVKDTIWTFEQYQGILYVVVPVRMTVVKLAAGGLLVYAPVAPTAECVRMVKELVAEHGDVKYIILPTTSGLEHKAFVGPFARYFSQAQVYVAPDQWSFPFNLPLSWLGLPSDRTHLLPQDSSKTPFANEFDYKILGSIDLGPGKFEEVAFFHRRSHTLLVTDLVVSVSEDPPAIVQLDSYPLLFHAKEDGADQVEDTIANRRKGWQRIVLFAFYFRPSALETIPLGQSFRDSFKARDRSRKNYFGVYPFKWKANWKQSFDALYQGRHLVVAPILQMLILNRAPKATLNWADQVARWDFQQVIPCHFDAPIKASPQQFRQAFAFLENQPFVTTSESLLLPQIDFELLKELDQNLSRRGIVPPARDKVMF